MSKVSGEPKRIRGCSTVWGVGTPNPHVVQGSTVLVFLVPLQKDHVHEAGDVPALGTKSLILYIRALQGVKGRGYEGTKPHGCLNVSEGLCPCVSTLPIGP